MMTGSRYRQISKIYDEGYSEYLWPVSSLADLSGHGLLPEHYEPPGISRKEFQAFIYRFRKDARLTLSEIKEWAEHRYQEEYLAAR